MFPWKERSKVCVLCCGNLKYPSSHIPRNAALAELVLLVFIKVLLWSPFLAIFSHFQRFFLGPFPKGTEIAELSCSEN